MARRFYRLTQGLVSILLVGAFFYGSNCWAERAALFELSSMGQQSNLVNINKATLEELDRLPLIGPKRAQAIIAYRTAHGPFKKIEDVMLVPGIGQGIFDSIKHGISVVSAPGEAIERLVAMVDGRFSDGTPTYGAGIVFGIGKGRVYIATADHVVRRGRQQAEELSVTFKQWPGEPFPAKIHRKPNPEIDLAVLSVAGSEGRQLTVDSASFCAQSGDNPPQVGQKVRHIGYLNYKPWGMNLEPDTISRISGVSIYFQSFSVGPGQSGGALVSPEGHLIGMVVGAATPEGIAIAMPALVQELRNEGYPICRPTAKEPPPPEEPVTPPPPSPIAGAECRYDFEGSAQGWIHETHESSAGALSAQPSEDQQHRGDRSLKVSLALSQTVPNGEVHVDLEASEEEAPLDLEDKEIVAWVWFLKGFEGNPRSPNGIQLFAKTVYADAAGAEQTGSIYGRWKNASGWSQDWVKLTLRLSNAAQEGVYREDGFDPKRVRIVGVKFGLGGKATADTRFSGDVFVDCVSW